MSIWLCSACASSLGTAEEPSSKATTATPVSSQDDSIPNMFIVIRSV